MWGFIAGLLVSGGILASMFGVGLTITMIRSARSAVRPVEQRRLPSVDERQTPETRSAESFVTVAGRPYRVVEEAPPLTVDTCPWCLGPVEANDPDVARCDVSYCRQVGHRSHNAENGGCGGVCSIAG